MHPYDWYEDDGIVWDRDGNVVDGHHRLAARQNLLEAFRNAIKRIEAKQVTAAFSALIAAQDETWVWDLICAGQQLAEND